MAGNVPTLDELKTFYDSELYRSMLSEFSSRSNREFDSMEFADMFRLFLKLTHCQRRYIVLDVPFAEVLSAIEKQTDKFLDYQVAAAEYFNVQEIDTTYLIERFCEFYLLQADNPSRLLNYLTFLRPSISFRPRQYAEEITKLYNQIE